MLRDDDVITIKDESVKGETRFVLYAAQFGDSNFLGERVTVTQNQTNGMVAYHVNFAGPSAPEEMKIILEGMLELTVLGDQLEHAWETKRAKKKS